MERERVAVDVLIVVPQPGSDPESTALKHPRGVSFSDRDIVPR